jgi:hypothetical protein
MSRKTIHTDYRLTVIGGEDHLLGKFYQIYDRDMEQETSEGEGIVLDWSEGFGYDRNLTGIPNKPDVLELIAEYVLNYGEPLEPIIMN